MSLAVSYALIALVFVFYGNTLFVAETGHSLFNWLYRSWTLDAAGGVDSSHGPLVIICTLFILWRKKDLFAASNRRTFYPALLPLLLGLFFHWCGLRAQQPMLSVMGLIILLWSVPSYIFGFEFARLSVFPFAYLVFAVPWNFLAGISFRLRLAASAASAAFLNGLAIPVTRVGTGLMVGAQDPVGLDVADPCSGLHSFTALLALTTVYAYFLNVSRIRKSVLVLLAVPIAVAANMARVMVLAIAAHVGEGSSSVERIHDISGYIVFAAAVVLTMAAAAPLSKWHLRTPGKPKEDRSSDD